MKVENHPQMRELAGMAREILIEVAPIVFREEQE